MKKLLGLMVACVAATFGILSCSGGSDDANATPGVMTMKQFLSGSKQFSFAGTSFLEIGSSGQKVDGSQNSGTEASRYGHYRQQNGGYGSVLMRYTILTLTDGVPTTARLRVTFMDGSLKDLNEDDDLLRDLGVPNGDSLMQTSVVFSIDYTARTATCATVVQEGGNAEDAAGDGQLQPTQALFDVYIQNSTF